MTNNTNVKKFDLEERTAKFGESVIRFCQKIPRGPLTDPLIVQLVKCGTSVGANYSEADDAESKLDFKHKIVEFAKKKLENVNILLGLWQEAKELNLIFNSIYKKVT